MRTLNQLCERLQRDLLIKNRNFRKSVFVAHTHHPYVSFVYIFVRSRQVRVAWIRPQTTQVTDMKLRGNAVTPIKVA